MAKGRRFHPPATNGNRWFCAKPHFNTFEKDESTLKELLPPPSGYRRKESQIVCRNQFPFSRHDNRNSFQDHGVYFGHGLGRRFLDVQRNNCSGDCTLVPVKKPKTEDSCYASSYTFPQLSEGAKFRRYTRNHFHKSMKTEEIPSSGRNILKTVKTPEQTPLHVLAITQEPFLHANTWVYSYKAKNYNKYYGP